MTDLKDKKVVVLGLGVDTQDVVPWLKEQGAQVTILDEKKGDKFDGLEKYNLIIRSPGVYRYRPEILAAEKAGVMISSKMKLFFDLCPAKIIGITGTKGKGTTATLIYEILKTAGKKVFLGGNIGTGVFDLLPKLTADSWVVLELSSFQLVDMTKSPHIAVVLMVTSEHLDWHPTTGDYVDAKKNITVHQSPSDFAVINLDYKNSVVIGKEGTAKKTWITGGQIEKVIDPKKILLRGKHNWENIVAAATVAELLGISHEMIAKTISNFRGLEHRLEEVREFKGVRFYNDSFSTTPETTIAAVKSFFEPLILIAGGSEKGSDFRELGETIVQAPNVKAVILIGLMADRIEKAMRAAKPYAHLQVLRGAKNMAEIVKLAYNNATSGDVVLLSPACASFDMFKNYKDRGQQFKDQVKKL